MKIQERYASAVRSGNLRSDVRTTYGDPDVLGAYGLADRSLTARNQPLAVPLERLLQGDVAAGLEIIGLLGDMGWKQARAMNIKCAKATAQDMARACLAWYRHGTCPACGGHGRLKVPGTTFIGPIGCKACRRTPSDSEGTGRIPFDRAIHPAELRPLASWMLAEMERASCRAGPAAMQAIAPTLDL